MHTKILQNEKAGQMCILNIRITCMLFWFCFYQSYICTFVLFVCRLKIMPLFWIVYIYRKVVKIVEVVHSCSQLSLLLASHTFVTAEAPAQDVIINQTPHFIWNSLGFP